MENVFRVRPIRWRKGSLREKGEFMGIVEYVPDKPVLTLDNKFVALIDGVQPAVIPGREVIFAGSTVIFRYRKGSRIPSEYADKFLAMTREMTTPRTLAARSLKDLDGVASTEMLWTLGFRSKDIRLATVLDACALIDAPEKPQPVEPESVEPEFVPDESVEPESVEPESVEQVTSHDDLLTRLVQSGQNVLLIGPAGCGKTTKAKDVAVQLGLRFGSISCTSGVSESQLTGWLLPVGDTGKFEYVPSTFVDMYENGGVFLLDELDAADPNVLLILNAALANGGFHIPHRIGNSYVSRHEDFRAIATANTLGYGNTAMYEGRAPLDEATLDRFRAGMLFMDYDIDYESTHVNRSLLEWAWETREVIRVKQYQRILSTRVLLDFTKQINAGIRTLSQCQEAYFATWTEDERRGLT